MLVEDGQTPFNQNQSNAHNMEQSVHGQGKRRDGMQQANAAVGYEMTRKVTGQRNRAILRWSLGCRRVAISGSTLHSNASKNRARGVSGAKGK